jgi:predicted PurR-regulated permease PerM
MKAPEAEEGDRVQGDRVTKTWDSRRIARTALIVATAFLSVWMLWRFLPALAWAGVLAIATWPLRAALAGRGMDRTALAILLTLVLAIVLVVPLIYIGIEVAHEGGAIVPAIRDIRQNGLGTPDWLYRLPLVGNSVANWWGANLADPEAARALLGRAETSGIFAFTRTLGIEVANRVITLVFTLLALFFLYRDGPSLIAESRVIAGRVFGPPGGHLGQNAVMTVRGTVNGLVLVGLGEGLLIGLSYFAAGLPHAALLGLATAVLAVIPFGAPVMFVLCALVLIAQSKTTAAIAIIIFGSVVVFIADHFVRPILIGSSTRLPFLWVLLGIFGGLETFGLVGLFLGPAVMSVLMAMWREGSEENDTARG